jgi:hypothetical protein
LGPLSVGLKIFASFFSSDILLIFSPKVDIVKLLFEIFQCCLHS